MIISRTPHRISFFGGGTDYPLWYREYGGKVLGASIDKFCYITLRYLPPYFEHKYRIVYSKVEMTKLFDEIQHPSVRETFRFFGMHEGLELHHDSDIPARSGMGSSSAFTVGLIKSLMALQGKITSKTELYKTAIHIEQNLIKENVGSQDQVWAACGGLNSIEFLQNGNIVVEPIIMKEENLNAFKGKFVLLFSGLSRHASEIVQEQIHNIPSKKTELSEMRQFVDEAIKILGSGKDDFRDFGKLLNENWKLKRSLSSKVSNPEIDEIYDTALRHGALGGKLLGAGGGGFLLFYVEPENQAAVKKALNKYLHVPFEFEFSGSEIILYQPSFYQ